MPLPIHLGGLGSPPPKDFEPDPLDETMLRALESTKGVAVEFSDRKGAEAMRFRFYRRRRELEKLGSTTFKDLVFTIDGSSLLIQRVDVGTLREL